MISAPAHDDTNPVPGFTSVDEVPEDLLDPHPKIEDEGDDSKLGAPEAEKLGGVRDDTLHALLGPPAPFAAPARARVVPLRRNLKAGVRGKDVIATKRALSHAGHLSWPKRWSLLAGPLWAKAVKSFQKAHHLKADGQYGIATHRLLVSGGHFDRYGAMLMAQAPRAKTQRHMESRDKLEAIALYGYHIRDRINYTQGASRMTIVRHHLRFPWLRFLSLLWEDCSSFVTGVYYTAKLEDPNHLGYGGWGFTGTLASHGSQTVNVQRGDLAFYGRAPYRHVTMHVGHSQRCVSHGSNSGPLLVSTFRYRGDYNHSRSYL